VDVRCREVGERQEKGGVQDRERIAQDAALDKGKME